MSDMQDCNSTAQAVLMSAIIMPSKTKRRIVVTVGNTWMMEMPGHGPLRPSFQESSLFIPETIH